MQKSRTKTIVYVAVLAAVATVLHMLRFPLPFMPPFMDFDLSGIPEIVGTFTLGPVAGVSIVLIKNVLKFLLMGSSSMLTGELQNIILSSAFILTAYFIYNRKKTRKSALIGMIAGALLCCTLAIFTNMFIIIPFYAKAYGLSLEQIIAMAGAANRLVDSTWKFVALGVVPFNLIKCGTSTLLMYLVYPTAMRATKREGQYAVQ